MSETKDKPVKKQSDYAYWEDMIMKMANLFVNIRTHVKIKIPGRGLCIAEGHRARLGTVHMLNGFGEIVNPDLDIQHRIFLTPAFQPKGIIGYELLPKVGFYVHSSNREDQGEVSFLIIEGLYEKNK